jgi:hypothetical protein
MRARALAIVCALLVGPLLATNAGGIDGRASPISGRTASPHGFRSGPRAIISSRLSLRRAARRLIIASVILWSSVVIRVWRPNPTEVHDDDRPLRTISTPERDHYGGFSGLLTHKDATR